MINANHPHEKKYNRNWVSQTPSNWKEKKSISFLGSSEWASKMRRIRKKKINFPLKKILIYMKENLICSFVEWRDR